MSTHPQAYTLGTNCQSVALRRFLSDWREAAVLLTTYQRGKPQPRACRGECGGGKNPPQISRRKDQAGSLGTEEKVSMTRSPIIYGAEKYLQNTVFLYVIKRVLVFLPQVVFYYKAIFIFTHYIFWEQWHLSSSSREINGKMRDAKTRGIALEPGYDFQTFVDRSPEMGCSLC
jgi:hypothetical protein